MYRQPPQQACVPPVIQVFEFLQPVKVFRLHGIVVFAPLLFQCVNAERYTEPHGSVLLYGFPGAASCSFNIPGTSTPAPSCRCPCVPLIDKRPLLSGA